MDDKKRGSRLIEEIVVYSELQPTLEEQSAGVVYRREMEGALFRQELVDEEIQDDEKRSQLRPNAGNISITVLAGEALGDISVNIQFEGKRGLHNQCLRNQGELLEAASDWIGGFLEQLGGDFDIVLEAKPCPYATDRLPLKRAAENLARTGVTVQTTAVKNPVMARNDVQVGE